LGTTEPRRQSTNPSIHSSALWASFISLDRLAPKIKKNKAFLVILPNPRKELALPLNGKKSKLTRNDFLQYFTRERLQINQAALAEVLARFRETVPRWLALLAQCFLSPEMKQKFLSLLEARAQRGLPQG
jgi:hypothetical protein